MPVVSFICPMLLTDFILSIVDWPSIGSRKYCQVNKILYVHYRHTIENEVLTELFRTKPAESLARIIKRYQKRNTHGERISQIPNSAALQERSTWNSHRRVPWQPRLNLLLHQQSPRKKEGPSANSLANDGQRSWQPNRFKSKVNSSQIKDGLRRSREGNFET